MDVITFLKKFSTKPIFRREKPQTNDLVNQVYQVMYNIIVTKDFRTFWIYKYMGWNLITHIIGVKGDE